MRLSSSALHTLPNHLRSNDIKSKERSHEILQKANGREELIAEAGRAHARAYARRATRPVDDQESRPVLLKTEATCSTFAPAFPLHVGEAASLGESKTPRSAAAAWSTNTGAKKPETPWNFNDAHEVREAVPLGAHSFPVAALRRPATDG